MSNDPNRLACCRLCEGAVPRVWDDVLECYAHTSDEPGQLRVCEQPWATCDSMPNARAFPIDPRGHDDRGVWDALQPVRACCRRIDILGHVPGVAWCCLPDHHSGECQPVVPKPLEMEATGPSQPGVTWAPRRRW